MSMILLIMPGISSATAPLTLRFSPLSPVSSILANGNMTIRVWPVAPPTTRGLYWRMKLYTLGHVSQPPSLPVKYVEPLFSLLTSNIFLARAPVPRIIYDIWTIAYKTKLYPTSSDTVTNWGNNINILRSEVVDGPLVAEERMWFIVSGWAWKWWFSIMSGSFIVGVC